MEDSGRSKKTEDGRYRPAESRLEMIDKKKTELDYRRPLTEGEVESLTEEFVVEYTYNSNAHAMVDLFTSITYIKSFI